MGRGKRRTRLKRKAVENTTDQVERGVLDPDSGNDDYYYDEVERLYHHKEKIPLNRDEDENEELSSSHEIANMGIDSPLQSDEDCDEDLTSNDGDIVASDLKASTEKAWGRRKKTFYHSDDEDELDDINDEDLAEDEEREAMLFQERYNQTLAEEDFELTDLLNVAKEKVAKAAEEENHRRDLLERIPRDISKLTTKEQLEILSKETPEVMSLIEDYKDKMSELGHSLHPLIQLAKCKGLLSSQGITYLETKYQLLLNYCVNVSLYLAMSAHKPSAEYALSLHDHPIISTLVEYRNLITEMNPLDQKVASEMEHLLEEYSKLNMNDIAERGNLEKKRKKEKRQHKSKASVGAKKGMNSSDSSVANKQQSVITDDQVNQYIENVLTKRKLKKMTKDSLQRTSNENVSTTDVAYDGTFEFTDGKRAIDYKISKNKGLTPRRRKENRNARVKYRNKYIKSQKKLVSQGVRKIVPELNRYGGEVTGIRSDIIRSAKLNF